MIPTEVEQLNLASNTLADMIIKGNVCIKTCINKSMKEIFEDALYVPDLRSNLMSVEKSLIKGIQ